MNFALIRQNDKVQNEPIKEKLSFNDMWQMFIEINENCKTKNDGLIYLKCLLNKRSSESNEISKKNLSMQIERLFAFNGIFGKWRNFTRKSDTKETIKHIRACRCFEYYIQNPL